MFAKILFTCILYATARLVESGTSYDQSQSGDLNVQVDLKGLHIIALMKGGKEEYVDYDYAYDYSEMTIKPLNGTTPKPLNATAASTDKLNTTTTTSSTAVTASNIYEDTTQAPLSTTGPQADTLQYAALDNSTFVESGTIDQMTLPTADPQTINLNGSISLNSTNSCRKGFVLNQKGECELKLQNPSTNALLKLVKLSQKLKLRRARKPTHVKPHHNSS